MWKPGETPLAIRAIEQESAGERQLRAGVHYWTSEEAIIVSEVVVNTETAIGQWTGYPDC